MTKKKKKINYDQWVIDLIVNKCSYTTEKAVSYLIGLPEDVVSDISYDYNCRNTMQRKKIYGVNQVQNQIILSSLLSGRGRMRQDDKGVSLLYMDDPRYIDMTEWLYFLLDEFTSGKRIFPKNLDNKKYDTKMCFQTVSTKHLLPYFNMGYLDIIAQLDIFGLTLLLVNNVWVSHRTKCGTINVKMDLTHIRDLNIQEEIHKYLLAKFNYIGLYGEMHQRKDGAYIAFDKRCNILVLEYIKRYIKPGIKSVEDKYEYILNNIDLQYVNKKSIKILKY